MVTECIGITSLTLIRNSDIWQEHLRNTFQNAVIIDTNLALSSPEIVKLTQNIKIKSYSDIT